MSMSKANLLKHTRACLAEIKDFLDFIDLGDYYVVHPQSNELTVASIIKGRDWLDEVYIEYRANIHPTWKLLPVEQWRRYKLWGCFEEHQECVKLSEHIPAFKKLIRSEKRPEFWKKGKVDARIKILVKSRNSRAEEDGAGTDNDIGDGDQTD